MEKFFEKDTVDTFVSKMSGNNTELQTKWDCNRVSFMEVTKTIREGEVVTNRINGNLRKNYIKEGMTGEEVISALNEGYSSIVRRFEDIKLYNVSGFGATEPTALPTIDGERLDVFYTGGYFSTTDGVNYTEKQRLVYSGYPSGYDNFWCEHFFRHNGYVYCISGSNQGKFILWKSTDNINFVYVRDLFQPINGANNIGNSCMFFDNGTWYFIYEAAGLDGYTGYQIFIASSTDLENGDFIDLQPYKPIIPNLGYDAPGGLGNPEIVMCKGVPYKYDGKYYITYHIQPPVGRYQIFRAYSYDLINWVPENPILDIRIPPINPEWTNHNQSICEFKGHTYMFYSNNTDQYITGDDGSTSCIDCLIDFRPLSEMMSLRW